VTARVLVCVLVVVLAWQVSGLVVEDPVVVAASSSMAVAAPVAVSPRSARVGAAVPSDAAAASEPVAGAGSGSVVADEAAFVAVLESRRELPVPLPVTETADAGGWVVVRAYGKPKSFEVHPSIAADVQALVDAAAADGIDLGGWGGWSHQRQHELRERNGCPDGWTHSEDEDPSLWAPASACRVPTARPGSSNHESGKAIDFTYRGKVIASFSSPAFKWLAANAPRYGLRHKIRREPWHWSPTGG